MGFAGDKGKEGKKEGRKGGRGGRKEAAHGPMMIMCHEPKIMIKTSI